MKRAILIITCLLLAAGCRVDSPGHDTLYNTSTLLKMAETEDAYFFIQHEDVYMLEKSSGQYICLLQVQGASCIVEMDEILYVLSGAGIIRLSPDTGDSRTVYADSDTELLPVMIPYRGNIYIVMDNGGLYRLNPSEGSAEPVFDGVNILQADGCSYAGGWLYFFQEGELVRIHPDGTGRESVEDSTPRLCGSTSQGLWYQTAEALFFVGSDGRPQRQDFFAGAGGYELKNIIGANDEYLFFIDADMQEGTWLCRLRCESGETERMLRLTSVFRDSLTLSQYIDFWIGSDAIFFWTFAAEQERPAAEGHEHLLSASTGAVEYFYMLSLEDLSITRLSEYVY